MTVFVYVNIVCFDVGLIIKKKIECEMYAPRVQLRNGALRPHYYYYYYYYYSRIFLLSVPSSLSLPAASPKDYKCIYNLC